MGIRIKHCQEGAHNHIGIKQVKYYKVIIMVELLSERSPLKLSRISESEEITSFDVH